MLIYRYVLHIDIAPKVVIYFGLEVRSPWNLIIGEGTIIGDKAVLDARYGITIGKNVNLSTEVYIWTLQHNVNSHDFGTEGKRGGVTICDRVWLSSRSTVLPGCIVSEGCVLAASAVMTKSCDTSFSILGGVPAKKISSRNNDIDYIFNGAHRYFL
ncbi:acyltransferase [Aerococcaceae bacterium DSM 109653]|uniref:Acyltransferase n=2 Tax=Fundicoccus ignavus TaxID=2664442 RepID=A0A844BFU6_9LACT|nr:acyltransferase [Fundicoccus ignavus]